MNALEVSLPLHGGNPAAVPWPMPPLDDVPNDQAIPFVYSVHVIRPELPVEDDAAAPNDPDASNRLPLPTPTHLLVFCGVYADTSPAHSARHAALSEKFLSQSTRAVVQQLRLTVVFCADFLWPTDRIRHVRHKIAAALSRHVSDRVRVTDHSIYVFQHCFETLSADAVFSHFSQGMHDNQIAVSSLRALAANFAYPKRAPMWARRLLQLEYEADDDVGRGENDDSDHDRMFDDQGNPVTNESQPEFVSRNTLAQWMSHDVHASHWMTLPLGLNFKPHHHMPRVYAPPLNTYGVPFVANPFMFLDPDEGRDMHLSDDDTLQFCRPSNHRTLLVCLADDVFRHAAARDPTHQRLKACMLQYFPMLYRAVGGASAARKDLLAKWQAYKTDPTQQEETEALRRSTVQVTDHEACMRIPLFARHPDQFPWAQATAESPPCNNPMTQGSGVTSIQFIVLPKMEMFVPTDALFRILPTTREMAMTRLILGNVKKASRPVRVFRSQNDAHGRAVHIAPTTWIDHFISNHNGYHHTLNRRQIFAALMAADAESVTAQEMPLQYPSDGDHAVIELGATGSIKTKMFFGQAQTMAEAIQRATAITNRFLAIVQRALRQPRIPLDYDSLCVMGLAFAFTHAWRVPVPKLAWPPGFPATRATDFLLPALRHYDAQAYLGGVQLSPSRLSHDMSENGFHVHHIYHLSMSRDIPSTHPANQLAAREVAQRAETTLVCADMKMAVGQLDLAWVVSELTATPHAADRRSDVRGHTDVSMTPEIMTRHLTRIMLWLIMWSQAGAPLPDATHAGGMREFLMHMKTQLSDAARHARRNPVPAAAPVRRRGGGDRRLVTAPESEEVDVSDTDDTDDDEDHSDHWSSSDSDASDTEPKDELEKESADGADVVLLGGVRARARANQDEPKKNNLGVLLNRIAELDFDMVRYPIVDAQKRPLVKPDGTEVTRYAIACQLRNQPVVMTDAELAENKQADPMIFQEAYDVLRMGTTADKMNNYTCPQYWCPSRRRAIRASEIKERSGRDPTDPTREVVYKLHVPENHAEPSCGAVLPAKKTFRLDDVIALDDAGQEVRATIMEFHANRYPKERTNVRPDGGPVPCCAAATANFKAQMQEKGAQIVRDASAARAKGAASSDDDDDHVNSSHRGDDVRTKSHHAGPTETRRVVDEDESAAGDVILHPKKDDKSDRADLPARAWGHVPAGVRTILRTVVETTQATLQTLYPTMTDILIGHSDAHAMLVRERTQFHLVTHGIHTDYLHQSFVACMADVLFRNQSSYIHEIEAGLTRTDAFKACLLASLTLDRFLVAHSGALLHMFASPDADDAVPADTDPAPADDELQSTMPISADLRQEATDSRLCEGLQWRTRPDHRQFLILAGRALARFRLFLQSSDTHLDHHILWDLVCMPHEKLFRYGINLVIFDMVPVASNLPPNLMCPSDRQATELFFDDRPTVVLLNFQEQYQPIYAHIQWREGTVDQRQEFVAVGEVFAPAVPSMLFPTMFAFFQFVVKPLYHTRCRDTLHASTDGQPAVADLRVVLQALAATNYTVKALVVNLQSKVIGVQAARPDEAGADDATTAVVPCAPSGIDSAVVDALDLNVVFVAGPQDPDLWRDYDTTRAFLDDLAERTAAAFPSVQCAPAQMVLDRYHPDLDTGLAAVPETAEETKDDDTRARAGQPRAMVTALLTAGGALVPIVPPRPLHSIPARDQLTPTPRMAFQGLDSGTDMDVDAILALEPPDAPPNSFRGLRQQEITRIQRTLTAYLTLRSHVRDLLHHPDQLSPRVQLESALRPTASRKFTHQHHLRRVVKQLRALLLDFVEFRADVDAPVVLPSDDPAAPDMLHLPSDMEQPALNQLADELIRYDDVRNYIFQPQIWMPLSDVFSQEPNLHDHEFMLDIADPSLAAKDPHYNSDRSSLSRIPRELRMTVPLDMHRTYRRAKVPKEPLVAPDLDATGAPWVTDEQLLTRDRAPPESAAAGTMPDGRADAANENEDDHDGVHCSDFVPDADRPLDIGRLDTMPPSEWSDRWVQSETSGWHVYDARPDCTLECARRILETASHQSFPVDLLRAVLVDIYMYVWKMRRWATVWRDEKPRMYAHWRRFREARSLPTHDLQQYNTDAALRDTWRTELVRMIQRDDFFLSPIDLQQLSEYFYVPLMLISSAPDAMLGNGDHRVAFSPTASASDTTSVADRYANTKCMVLHVRYRPGAPHHPPIYALRGRHHTASDASVASTHATENEDTVMFEPLDHLLTPEARGVLMNMGVAPP